jgi:phosphoribosylformimino-5-aminoimidazole carboxamide ribotide isomerase
LASLGIDLMVDAGIRDRRAAREILASGVRGVIAGLETVERPTMLGELVETCGPEALWFSLDLKNGTALGDGTAWPDSSPFGIAAQAIELGITRLIVLDLAHVGERRGVGTEDLCRRILEEYPKTHVAVGGGIRHNADIERLQQLGVTAALVATALHEGRLQCAQQPPAKPAART